MKKLILTTAIVMGLVTVAFSQATQVFQPDTILLLYDHSFNLDEGDTMELVMTYNDKGLFSKCEQYYSQQLAKNNDFKAGVDFGLPLQVRTIYEYDISYNMVHSMERYFGVPRNPRLYYDYYFENNQLFLYVCHYETIEEYDCTDSVLYQYDNSGRIDHETMYSRIYGVLGLSKEIDYSYNNSVVEKTTNGLSYVHWGDWVTLERKTQTFGDDGTLLTVVTESYENPTTLETYSYDGEGRITSILTQTQVEGEWVNTKLLEYTYDAEGHLILAEIKSWQEDEFVHLHRAVYELNEAGYPAVVDFQKWNGEEWVQGNWKAGFYIFNEPYLSRQNDFLCRIDAKHIEISYTETELPNYEVEERPIEQAFATLHPNPTTGLVAIAGEDLKAAEAFNALGQRVATATASGTTLQIDLSGLPAGIYFVNVSDKEGRKCVRKVVKE